MADKGCVLLDTRAFDKALEMRDEILGEYDAINTKYDTIVKTLLQNWKGKGADAFRKDSDTVRTNIVGIYDIVKTMCDTLADCKDIFSECDQSLGDYNKNSGGE